MIVMPFINNERMSSKKAFLVSSCLAMVLGFTILLPSWAKEATTLSVKIGYFNLASAKAAYPEAVGVEALKEEALNQLRRYAEEGNKRIDKAREEKKSTEDIQKLIKDLQAEVDAKQRAFSDLIQTANARASEKIVQTVNAVAKERNLDIVIDAAGIFTGGQKILDSGIDITDAIVKKLNPQLVRGQEESSPKR
jgi:Skp family chaperone for outer membrane proteins